MFFYYITTVFWKTEKKLLFFLRKLLIFYDIKTLTAFLKQVFFCNRKAEIYAYNTDLELQRIRLANFKALHGGTAKAVQLVRKMGCEFEKVFYYYFYILLNILCPILHFISMT